MSAVDEIRDAIDKLEALRSHVPDVQKVVRWEDFNGSPSYSVENGYRFRGMANSLEFGEDLEAATLIVTLHRTIDAQLTALRMAVDYLANGFHEDSGVPQIGIGTARAINGVTS